MKKHVKAIFAVAACLLAAFVLWTVLVRVVDVQAIGPEGSSVGFATLNGRFHELTGVHLSLYDATDLLSVIPLGIIAGFGLLGLIQWIRRKSFLKVDPDILALGGFYVVVLAVFFLFEVLAVNYRPVLIEGVLEASYPSSTTMLVLCVMPTAMIVLGRRIRHTALRASLLSVMGVFTAFMLIGRVISAVHWLTDIIGGILLSAGLVLLYVGVCSAVSPKEK